jgi:hypothetical protein
VRQLQVRRDAAFALQQQPLRWIVRRLILHGVKLFARWALKNRQEELVYVRMIAGPRRHKLINRAPQSATTKFAREWGVSNRPIRGRRDRHRRDRFVARSRLCAPVIVRGQDS